MNRIHPTTHEIRDALRKVFKDFAASEPSDLVSYLSRINSTRPLVPGTTVPHLGATFSERRVDHLLVPTSLPLKSTPVGMSVFLCLSDYFDRPEGISAQTIAHAFVLSQPKDVHLNWLAALNLIAEDEEALAEARQHFESILKDTSKRRFQRAMNGKVDNAERIFMARQSILRSIHWLLTIPSYAPFESDNPPAIDAILLVHALNDLMSAPAARPPEVQGLPSHLVLESALSTSINMPRDPYVALDCYSRLWTQIGPTITDPTPRRPPTELAEEATKMTFEDLVMCGLSIMGFGTHWRPPQPATLPRRFAEYLPETVTEAYLAVAGASLGELRDRANLDESGFGVAFLRDKPMAVDDEKVTILDWKYASETITSSLYWIVRDHEETNYGDKAGEAWHLTYSKMLEALALEQIRKLAVPSLKPADTTFYDENDLRKIFPSRKVCDACLHRGADVILLEIYGGKLRTGRNDRGEVSAFQADVNNAVYKKARQLDQSIRTVTDHETKLTGHPRTRDFRIIPLVVVAEGFPLNPVTRLYLDRRLDTIRNLRASHVLPLGVIDVFDLVMLEGLAGQGAAISDVLRQWILSPYFGVSLASFIHATYSSPPNPPRFMPKRAQHNVRDLIRRTANRYNLAEWIDAENDGASNARSSDEPTA